MLSMNMKNLKIGDKMNKLMGFYELQQLNLPAVKWKEYSENVVFNEELLWTIRSAVWKGDDLNLPRLVGCKAGEAKKFANSLLSKMSDDGIVIYYPFFIADKSGTLEIRKDSIIIEAVKNDLWNLVTNSKCDVTYKFINGVIEKYGNSNFLNKEQIEALLSHVPKLRKEYIDFLNEGRSVLLEWSLAYDCGIDKERVGELYLVFYEIRTV